MPLKDIRTKLHVYNYLLMFQFYHCVNDTTGGGFLSEGITSTTVNTSVLAFIVIDIVLIINELTTNLNFFEILRIVYPRNR